MIVTQTPLRLSFAGGGTDFPEFYRQEEGAVVSTAIDRSVYVVLKERFDKKIRVAYTRIEVVDHPDEIAHDLVRECLKRAGVRQGMEVSTLADVPSEGSGLGSSSSLTVGLLHALYAYMGRPCDAETLARDACEIELEALGRPIGKQDAYIAAYGGMRMFHFLPSGEVVPDLLGVRAESVGWLEDNLLLFFTGRTRRAEEILARQKAKLADTIETYRRLQQLAWELRACLLNGLGVNFARLLDCGWQHKKTLARGISDNALDEMYGRARAAGALGGKISGAGGGGFMLLCCPPERHAAVRRALGDLQELAFKIEHGGSRLLIDTESGVLRAGDYPRLLACGR